MGNVPTESKKQQLDEIFEEADIDIVVVVTPKAKRGE